MPSKACPCWLRGRDLNSPSVEACSGETTWFERLKNVCHALEMLAEHCGPPSPETIKERLLERVVFLPANGLGDPRTGDPRFWRAGAG
jgi:hypothetical protein